MSRSRNILTERSGIPASERSLDTGEARCLVVTQAHVCSVWRSRGGYSALRPCARPLPRCRPSELDAVPPALPLLRTRTTHGIGTVLSPQASFKTSMTVSGADGARHSWPRFYVSTRTELQPSAGVFKVRLPSVLLVFFSHISFSLTTFLQVNTPSWGLLLPSPVAHR